MDTKDIEKALQGAGFNSSIKEVTHIGEGNYGNVYKVVMQDRSEPLAAKVPKKKSIFPDEGEVAFLGFLNEEDNSKNCPASVARIRAIDGNIVIMDYVEGLSLDELVEKADEKKEAVCDILGGLGDTVSFVKNLLGGVGFLNGKNYIHGDIKCSNILVSGTTPPEKGSLYSKTVKDVSKPSAKIIDFGFFREAEFASRRCGTLLYAAPEILKAYGDGLPYDNSKVDTWALGITLLTIFSEARYPNGINFTGGNDFWETVARFKNLGENPEKFKERVEEVIGLIEPRELQDILEPMIEKMLVFDPAQRITMKEAEDILDKNYSLHLEKNNLLSSLSNNNNINSINNNKKEEEIEGKVNKNNEKIEQKKEKEKERKKSATSDDTKVATFSSFAKSSIMTTSDSSPDGYKAVTPSSLPESGVIKVFRKAKSTNDAPDGPGKNPSGMPKNASLGKSDNKTI
ncbi:MAG: protein kinase [Rickettsiales bacterium]|jgi:serine/threonine protein kinase|nr:protein kinase [Rickettsiales bacterium]